MYHHYLIKSKLRVILKHLQVQMQGKDKARADMKKFINSRRNEFKQLKVDSSEVGKLQELLVNGDHDAFDKQLSIMQPDQVYRYLMSEDQYLRSPLIMAFEQQNWFQICQAINQWSKRNFEFVKNNINLSKNANTGEGERNNYHFMLKKKFENLVRVISNPRLDQIKLCAILQQKNAIYSEILTIFLSYSNTVLLIPDTDHLRMFEDILSKVAQSLNLPSAQDIIKFANLKRREKTWDRKQFINRLDNPYILSLGELGYNFMHELAQKHDESTLFKILDKLESGQTTAESKRIDNLKETYFCNFDSVGDTSVDIILSKWSYKSITKFLQRAQNLDCVYFSVNCLNKVICNGQLTNREVQRVIDVLLNGQVASRGYSERVSIDKLVKTKKLEKYFKKQGEQFVIVMDRRKVLMAKDKRQSYPLLNYLDRFPKQCGLKTTLSLSFQLIDRQVVKSKVISLISKLGIVCHPLPQENEALKQIQQIKYYQESLINMICRLPHGEVLEHFVDKMFINYFSILIYSAGSIKPVLHLVNKHFLTTYIQLNPNIENNEINKKIINKIFEAKANQKMVGQFRMEVELIRQLYQHKAWDKQSQMTNQIKSKLKAYVRSLSKQQISQSFTYFNEGSTQNKVRLIDLLPCLFTDAEIEQLNLQEAPMTIQTTNPLMCGNKKILRRVDYEKYQYKRTYKNFEKECEERLKNFERSQDEQSLRPIESAKEQKQKMENQKENKEQKQNEKKQIELGSWTLNWDQPDLEKKLNELINQGFEIKFNAQKKLNHESELKLLATIDSKAYKAVLSKIMGWAHHRPSFNITCFCCAEEDTESVFEFLASAPNKFKKSQINWSKLQLIDLNPFILLKVLKNSQLKKDYSLLQNRNQISQAVKRGMIRIVSDLKTTKKSTKIDPDRPIRKMLVYKQALQHLQISEGYRHILSEFMKMHSTDINLSNFMKHFSIQELVDHYSAQEYIIALLASPQPIKLLLEMKKMIKAEAKLKQQQKLKNQKQKQKQDDGKQQKQAVSKLTWFDILLNSPSLLRQFCQILTNLSDKDFDSFLDAYEPFDFKQLKNLMTRLSDERKCLKVLDIYLTQKQSQISPPVQQVANQEKAQKKAKLSTLNRQINGLARQKFSNFNASLCAFASSNTKLYFRNQQPGNKIIVDHLQFIQTCKEQNYQYFLRHIQIMLSIDEHRMNSQQKIDVLNSNFVTLFHAEQWIKAQKLVEKLKKVKGKLNPAEAKQIYSSFISSSLNVCVKNRSRQQKYKHKNQYDILMKCIFALLTDLKISDNEDIFRSVWSIVPDEALKMVAFTKITFKTLCQSLRQHPQKLKIIQSTPLIPESLPSQYLPNNEGEYLPLSHYPAGNFQKFPYLVDLMIFQQSLRRKWAAAVEADKIKLYQTAFDQKKKSVFLVPEIMKRHNQIYNKQEVRKYCIMAFSPNLKTIKDIPKQYIDAYFQTRVEIRGVNNLSDVVIKQLIDAGYVSEQHIFDIVKSCRMPIIEYFLSARKIVFNYDIVKNIEDKHLQGQFFTKVIIGLDNIAFAVDFAKRYRIFEIYPEERYNEMIGDALLSIAVFKNTTMLQLLLTKLKQKLKVTQLKFEQAYKTEITMANPYSQLQKHEYEHNYKLKRQKNIAEVFVPSTKQQSGVRDGVVHLPVQVAIVGNFYEYYFLLKQQGKQIKGQQFNPSSRFRFEKDSKKYSFIPMMQQRVNLLNAVNDIYGNNQKMEKNIMMGVFELAGGEKEDSLRQFLSALARGEINLTPSIKNSYYAVFTLWSLKYAPMFDDELSKMYPSEHKLINSILPKFPVKVTGLEYVHAILKDKQILRTILYSSHPKYMIQWANGKSWLNQPLLYPPCYDSQFWPILFSSAFTMQVRYFQHQDRINFLKQFINVCYFQTYCFNQSSEKYTTKPFEYKYNEQKMRDILICCIVSKYSGNGNALKVFCDLSGKKQDQILVDLAIWLCTFKQFNADSPLQENNLSHNPALWGRIIKQLDKMENLDKFVQTQPFSTLKLEKQYENFNPHEYEAQFKDITQGLKGVYACLAYLTNLIYLMSEQHELRNYLIMQNQSKQEEAPIIVKILLDKKLAAGDHTTPIISKVEFSEIDNKKIYSITTNYEIVESLPIRFFRFDNQRMKDAIQRKSIENSLNSDKIIESIECLAKLEFIIDGHTFNKVKLIGLYRKLLGDKLSTGSLSFKVTEQINKLKQLIELQKQYRIFSLSDVHGPFVINDQTDKNKVIECLSFYQMNKLPDCQIKVQYIDGPIGKEQTQSSQTLISDMNEYVRYFRYEINDDQEQNKTAYRFSNCIKVIPHKSSEQQFDIVYDEFHPHNIVNTIEKINKYGRQISATFNNEVFFKYSIASILNIVEKHEKSLQTSHQVIDFIGSFLSSKRHVHFVENLLIMVSEDANNIMKAVKGILLTFDYKDNWEVNKDQKYYKALNTIAYYGIDYRIDEHMFIITLKTGPPKKNQTQNFEPSETNLISRKDFLNSVFSSTEFLTGYFLNKQTLANELVKISRDISEKVNSVVNFSISYKGLEQYVDKIKQKVSIKQIDGFLSTLSTYISTNFVKFIEMYINSAELAARHQISLLDCFSKMRSNVEPGEQSNQLRFKLHDNKFKGITQVYNFSSELKNSTSSKTNIKNMYLIQIYKSYFASVVREGMAFILGYKTNRPTVIVNLQKKQDVDKVNIAEISFLLLISNRVPTTDEIDHNKIIKIFVADLNDNIYELGKEVTEKLFALPEQSDDRTLAHIVPVLESNIILTFSSEHSIAESSLRDDKSNRYLDLNLQKDAKFKIKIKNQSQISCINKLKIDSVFNNSVSRLIKSINGFIQSDLVLKMKTPDHFDVSTGAQIFTLTFLDFDQAMSNIFFEPNRNRQLQLYASVQKKENIQQNLILRERKKLFSSLFAQIVFEICEQGDSKMRIQGKTIKISLASKLSHSLNSNLMTDIILKHCVEQYIASSPQLKKLYQFKQSQSQTYSTILDQLLISSYQIAVINETLELSKNIKLVKNVPASFGFRLAFNQKSKLEIDGNRLIFNIRLNSLQRQFFSADKILFFLLNNTQPPFESFTSTKYNLQANCIQFYNFDTSRPIILVNAGRKIVVQEVKHEAESNSKKSVVPYQLTADNTNCYFAIQSEGNTFNVSFNYFWKPTQTQNYINQKKVSNVLNHKHKLLLVSASPITLAESTINAQIQTAKTGKSAETFSILKKVTELDVNVRLLSRQMLQLEISSSVSGTVCLYLGSRFKILTNQALQSVSIQCISSSQLVQQNTKFLQLIFRNKSLKPSINESDNKQQYAIFSQPAQRLKAADKGMKKDKNVESMVYIVNEQARKYLTRAGEVRVDVISLCDADGNAINYSPETKIYFKHLNVGQEVIVPQIKCEANNPKVELHWTPILRGPYQIFINSIRLNPIYEIGVSAAVIDIKSCQIELPKKIEICFMEQSECSLVLRDQYGNIYTELEEAIINDSLIIQIVCQELEEKMIRVKADKIDKYGLKKIRFSVDDPTASEPKKIKLALLVNMEKLVEFQMKLNGQSLAQRRKNLEKDIDGCTKKHYTDAVINRANFMQSLFKLCQKSVDKVFSIKFVGEQGIDAGGLKRQFYDMIGKEMKDPQNPFFMQTDHSRHNEYFINPEILKNKKKIEYMTMFGKLLANSFLNSYLIGINFSPTFVKLLYEDPITFEDMLSVLPKEEADRYEFLQKADAEYIDDLQIYFSCIFNKRKGVEVDMIENGRNTKVTKANVQQYLDRLPQFLIAQRYEELFKAFKQGFDSVFKLDLLRRWIRPDQFWCMTAGVKQITPEIVLSYVVIQGGKQTHHAWFRSYISEASKQILEGFLKFSSGSSSIDFYQSSKITVVFEKQGENPKKLPISHTCWKQIEIPAYRSFQIMKQLLNAAFLYCSEGFGFG